VRIKNRAIQGKLIQKLNDPDQIAARRDQRTGNRFRVA
jgi:hypothetical protein